MKRAICADRNDNVVTLVEHTEKGETVSFERAGSMMQVKLEQSIPIFHKFAVTKISKGDTVLKYGESIGRATSEILPGEHVHIHNVESSRGRGDQREGTK